MKKYFQAPWQWKYLAVAALASIFCLALNFIICVVIIYGNFKIPGYRFEEGYLSLGSRNILWLISIGFLYLLILPIVEEVVFRGITLQYLTSKFGNKLGISMAIIVAVIIGLPFHSPIPALIFSTIATFTSYKSNSILPAIIFHIANNFLIFMMLLSLGRGLVTL